MITIITPTYNRAELLKRLYGSILSQKSKAKWLVIDDGSTDETEHLVADWLEQNLIDIEYIKKENGGKHSALNIGFDSISQGWVFFVDSDDYLVENAIEYLENKISSLKDEKIVVVQKQFPNGDILSSLLPKETVDINTLLKKNVAGDKSEIYHYSLLSKYRFPVFINESFMSESPMHYALSSGEKIKCFNKSLTVCEYLDLGLSSNSLNNRIKSINSTLYVYEYQFDFYKKNKLFMLKMIAGINLCRFTFHSKRQGLNKNKSVSTRLCWLPGFMFYLKDVLTSRD